MRKIDTRVYRITVTLKSSKTGTLELRVSALDDDGRAPGVLPVPAAPLTTTGPDRTGVHRTGSDRDHRPMGAPDRDAYGGHPAAGPPFRGPEHLAGLVTPRTGDSRGA